MNWWDRFSWQLGFCVCHQQPERLLRFGGHSLFVCARDTGLFVSFFTVLLMLSLLRGRKRGGRAPWPVIVLATAGIIFLVWDGLTSYLGYRESGNVIRFLSGFTAGAGLAVLLAPLMNREVFGGDKGLKTLSRPTDFIAIAIALGTTVALYLVRPEPLFRLAQVWLAICLLGTFWSLNLLLVFLVIGRRSPGFSLTKALAAILLTGLELGGSYMAHRLILGHGPEPPGLSGGSWFVVIYLYGI